MFEKLFAANGLSLDRLRVLLEVNAAGSITKAAGGDPVRQSQYSRQIKELEDFFQVKLLERHGKGIRLTANGKELTRISRFFLMGLSNFQRGSLKELQTFRIGASSTFTKVFLLPLLQDPTTTKPGASYALENVPNEEVERRLHDLTLDFGIVTSRALSRPLQTAPLLRWRLHLCVPRQLCKTEAAALNACRTGQLPLVFPIREVGALPNGFEPYIACNDFLEARAALDGGHVAAILPEFLLDRKTAKAFLRLPMPENKPATFQYLLAWNPRLLRLNPHAVRKRDFLLKALSSP